MHRSRSAGRCRRRRRDEVLRDVFIGQWSALHSLGKHIYNDDYLLFSPGDEPSSTEAAPLGNDSQRYEKAKRHPAETTAAAEQFAESCTLKSITLPPAISTVPLDKIYTNALPCNTGNTHTDGGLSGLRSQRGERLGFEDSNVIFVSPPARPAQNSSEAARNECRAQAIVRLISPWLTIEDRLMVVGMTSTAFRQCAVHDVPVLSMDFCSAATSRLLYSPLFFNELLPQLPRDLESLRVDFQEHKALMPLIGPRLKHLQLMRVPPVQQHFNPPEAPTVPLWLLMAAKRSSQLTFLSLSFLPLQIFSSSWRTRVRTTCPPPRPHTPSQRGTSAGSCRSEPQRRGGSHHPVIWIVEPDTSAAVNSSSSDGKSSDYEAEGAQSVEVAPAANTPPLQYGCFPSTLEDALRSDAASPFCDVDFSCRRLSTPTPAKEGLPPNAGTFQHLLSLELLQCTSGAMWLQYFAFPRLQSIRLTTQHPTSSDLIHMMQTLGRNNAPAVEHIELATSANVADALLTTLLESFAQLLTLRLHAPNSYSDGFEMAHSRVVALDLPLHANMRWILRTPRLQRLVFVLSEPTAVAFANDIKQNCGSELLSLLNSIMRGVLMQSSCIRDVIFELASDHSEILTLNCHRSILAFARRLSRLH